MDNRYKETFKTWNKIADLYEEKFMNLTIYNDSYDLFCNLISNKKSSILELGCGPGNITKYILNKNPNYHITGIDIAPNMIKLAKKNNPLAHFKTMDIREINILNNKYDAILCGFILPYLSKTDSEKFIRDCMNLLNPNGIIYLSFVAGEYANSTYKTDNNGDKMQFYYHNKTSIKKLFIKNKLELLNELSVEYKRNNDSEIHTVLIVKKN